MPSLRRTLAVASIAGRLPRVQAGEGVLRAPGGLNVAVIPEAMGRVPDREQLAAIADQVGVSLRVLGPDMRLAPAVLRVRVALMDRDHCVRRVDHRDRPRSGVPDDPVVVSRPADDEGRQVLVLARREREVVDPQERVEPTVLECVSPGLLPPLGSEIRDEPFDGGVPALADDQETGRPRRDGAHRWQQVGPQHDVCVHEQADLASRRLLAHAEHVVQQRDACGAALDGRDMAGPELAACLGDAILLT